MLPKDGKVKLHMFVDQSSVEVFGNDGTEVITDQLFPKLSSNKIRLYSKGGGVKIEFSEDVSIKIYLE